MAVNIKGLKSHIDNMFDFSVSKNTGLTLGGIENRTMLDNVFFFDKLFFGDIYHHEFEYGFIIF